MLGLLSLVQLPIVPFFTAAPLWARVETSTLLSALPWDQHWLLLHFRASRRTPEQGWGRLYVSPP